MAGAADATTPAAEPKAIAEADASADLAQTPASASAAAARSDAATADAATAATAASEPAPVGRARASAMSTRLAAPAAPATVAMAAMTIDRDRDAQLLLDMSDSIPSPGASPPNSPESPNPLRRNTQTKFFKHAHIFVEMDELREKVERDPVTHRFERVSSCKKKYCFWLAS